MFKNKWLERLLWLALLAALIYTAHNTLKTFVLMSFKVPTPSMEPPNSLDSRFWGLVPDEFIVGKVILVY